MLLDWTHFATLPQLKQQTRSESGTRRVRSDGASSTSSDSEGRRRKPRLKKNADPAVSHIAVCDSVSEKAEVIADSLFAIVDRHVLP